MSITIKHLEGPLAGKQQPFDDSYKTGRTAGAQVSYPAECSAVGEKHLKLMQNATVGYTMALCGTHYVRSTVRKPRTAVKGFGNRLRKWCDEAGLPQHCSAHGLRKAGSARLAELGASDREIMAITGHQTAKEVDRYTKGARQKRLAASAMEKWEQEGYE